MSEAGRKKKIERHSKKAARALLTPHDKMTPHDKKVWKRGTTALIKDLLDEGEKAPLIWCVEDYAEFRRQFKELVAVWFPAAKFEAFPDAMAMRGAEGSPAIILLDVAGMTGGATPGSGIGIETFIHLAVGTIREHPGAVVGMYSAVGTWAKDIVADVKKELPDVVIEQFDGMDHQDLKRFLEKFMGESK